MSKGLPPIDRRPIREFARGRRYVLVLSRKPRFASNYRGRVREQQNARGGSVYDAWADKFLTERPYDAQLVRVRQARNEWRAVVAASKRRGEMLSEDIDDRIPGGAPPPYTPAHPRHTHVVPPSFPICVHDIPHDVPPPPGFSHVSEG